MNISSTLVEDLRSATRVAGATGTWVLVGSPAWACTLTGCVGFPGVRFLLADVPFDFAAGVLDHLSTAPAFDLRGMVLALTPETWRRARLIYPFLRLGALTIFEHPSRHDPALAD